MGKEKSPYRRRGRGRYCRIAERFALGDRRPGGDQHDPWWKTPDQDEWCTGRGGRRRCLQKYYLETASCSSRVRNLGPKGWQWDPGRGARWCRRRFYWSLAMTAYWLKTAMCTMSASTIMVWGWDNRFRDERWFPNTNVVIRNNFTRDSGGDSIVVVACDKPLIENNEGIAPPSVSPMVVVPMPRVCGHIPVMERLCATTKWWGSLRIKMGRHSMWTPTAVTPWSNTTGANETSADSFCYVLPHGVPGNSGIVVRYNLSIDDANKKASSVLWWYSDITIENNAFLNSFGEEHNMNLWRKSTRGGRLISFKNNLLSTPGKMSFKGDEWVIPTFQGNTYAGSYQGMPVDRSGVTMKHPATGKNGKVSAVNKQSTSNHLMSARPACYHKQLA